METWEQEIKKIVNPTLPSEIEDLISRTLHQIPRKERKVKVYYALPAAVLVVCMLFGASAISPAFAETMGTIPVIGSIFEKVGNIGEQKASHKGLASPLGQQVTIDGETVTFTESLYDGSSIYLGFIKDSDRLVLWNNIQVSIDGKRLNDFFSNASGKTLENGQFAGIYSIQADPNIPNSFTLGLSSPDSNSWHVELPVKLQGEKQAYLINDKREWLGKSAYNSCMDRKSKRYEEIQKPQRVEGTVNQYQATFASKNTNDDLIIGTDQFQPIDYLEDLTITFDLK